MTHSPTALANPQPFQIDLTSLRPLTRFAATIASPAINWVLALRDLNNIHARARMMSNPAHFCVRALSALNVSLQVDHNEAERIPATGSLVVVANHPFGGIDGLALLALLKRRRTDVKILANHLLRRIPEMADDCFFVDPFGGADATSRNLASMRAALRWVKSGGALAVFPAGEVSSLELLRGGVADTPWNPAVAGLVRAAKAPVLPVFFEGQNSSLFQTLGLLSPRLRTLMLPRELLKRRGSTLQVHVGNCIPSAKLARFDSNEQIISYLRVRTDLLSGRTHRSAQPKAAASEQIPIAPEFSPDLIGAELEALPIDQHLASSGSFRVSYGTANQLPTTLREIGRLREITFRRVGEGTGKSLDIDSFDQRYLHLLVWDQHKKQIVGAYRLGLTDELLAVAGKDGLYTHTLFQYRDELLEQIGPAIELGRSFVRPEYQKEFAPLMLLWRGIALFVAKHPKYRMLFGPVSVSNDYRSMTKQLLIEFLKINTPASEDLQKLVLPRNPPKFGRGRSFAARLAGTIVRTIDGIDELVGEIESDRLGMPVLLRQYLKLNAKLLGFNVDPDFGDVLDGLMLVDLTKVERAILTRYMGRENVVKFLSFHSV
ncbi:GNAT family N-acetyltransferase [soil metagenome]